jgi:hypothetical protein
MRNQKIYDAQHIFFLHALYKYCSKMLAGKNNVLDVGYGEELSRRIIDYSNSSAKFRRLK